ncbi:MAG TPA: DUF3300 domain-containing protein [Candidatus Acidoferrales bacterium]|nr:DUF3300 domain-containing protein [Candidatus Acidoferrales bacterium]
MEFDARGDTKTQGITNLTRQGLAVVLSGLMILVPAAQNNAFAQESAPFSQQAPAQQPLSPEQLDQLVAPIALYPDPLVAQVLAASTYPQQVQEADRWRQAQGNAPADVIAAGAEAQNWDPSVKALTAFPTVLAQMDRNIQWTTSLGDAYYNQPQDVMDAVQTMRQKAYAAGHLRNSPQQVVTSSGGAITVAPANPSVVYVPVYDPWVVYGAPVAVYPGYFYATPPGVVWGAFAIGFGVGIGVAIWAHHGWGWGHWGMRWHDRRVVYNHTTYITRSTTVINHGWGRPGGPRFYDRHPQYAHGGWDRHGREFHGPHSGGYHAVAGGPHGGSQHAAYHGGPSRDTNGSRNNGRPHSDVNHTASAHASRPANRDGHAGRENGGHMATPQRASINTGHGGAAHGSTAPHGGRANAPHGGGHADAGHGAGHNGGNRGERSHS